MNCEICKIIESHGLDRSVHDWWHCSDAENASRSCRKVDRKPVWLLLRTCRQLKMRWTRLVTLSPRRGTAVSKPQAIGRELKLISYTLAAHIGTQLK